MCGVVGWFQRDGGPVDVTVLQNMNEQLVHRGPDDRGVWHDGSIGLGHRRLAIRDLTPLGRQPLADISGRIVISFNGEIYNDAELRRELVRTLGVTFRSNCDAETIPYAFVAWGVAAFERFEGMFALALWDRDERTLHLVRDGIGIKPLFYSETPNAVLCASEPKAIFEHPEVRRAINPEGLHTFLATGYPGPESSIYAGLRQVPPGTVVSFTARDRTVRRFWRPQRRPEIHQLDVALAELGDTLETVVESQMIADVPVGVLQSGGIDSTLVTLAAVRRRTNIPIFTATFNDKSYDESVAASTIARVANCPQHLVATDNQDPEEVLESVAYHSDGQCADTGVFAYYQLAQAVRRTTTVALSGDGGDEFFGGYSTYTATRFASRLVLPSVRPYVERAGLALYSMFPGAESRMPRTALFARLLLGIGAGDAPPHLQWRRLVPRPLLVSLYGPRMAGLIRKTPFAAYQAAFDDEDGDLLDKALIADQRYHIQSVLMKVDLMSMAHGLEVRVPLLDRRIMDVAGRISLGLLMPLRGPRKFVLRSLAARLGAPPEVTTGKKKGFNVPLAALMRGPLARVGNRLLDRDADILAPFISPDGLRHLWRMHRDVKANHAFALWPLFVLAAYWSNGHRRTSITSTVAASPA